MVDKLAQETQMILKLPETQKRLGELGAEPVGSSPAEFAQFVRAEIDKWARVVKTSGARLD
jgi:tripartite-type tricarboxylate transporter receptor subunit TctC